ncbi:hypothetical protein H0H92_002229 [Tricholoma furcatifolium]|nr:hypothetical protein H0H92_002229 [Tricholoma furcatifolium]
MDFAANFTTHADPSSLVCEKCKKIDPNDKDWHLEYLRDINPAKPGYFCCKFCIQKYRDKSIRGRSASKLEASESSAISVSANVRQHVNAAQRGDAQIVVRPVGNVSHRPAAPSSHYPSNVMGPPPLLSGSISTGPVIRREVNNPFGEYMRPPPDQAPSAPVEPGYTSAHSHYVEMRRFYQQLAYAPEATAELIIVRVTMKVLLAGKKGPVPTQVHTICESMDNIPVRIGAISLKKLAFAAVLHQFIQWSSQQLDIDECVLRSHHWVEILPATPDVNAISEPFFRTKGSSKVKVFVRSTKPLDIFLVISTDKYNAILEGMEKEMDNWHSQPSMFDRVVNNVLDRGFNKRKLSIEDSETSASQVIQGSKRTRERPRSTTKPPTVAPLKIRLPRKPARETTHPQEADTSEKPTEDVSNSRRRDEPLFTPSTKVPTTPVVSQGGLASNAITFTNPVHPQPAIMQGMLDITKLRKALTAQTGPRRVEIKKFLTSTVVDVRVYLPPTGMTLKELVDKPKALSRVTEFPSKRTTLSYHDVSPAAGSFKASIRGQTSQPLFDEERVAVCLKRAYVPRPGNATPSSVAIEYHEGPKQVELLTIELNCLGWASALMEDAYQFMDQVDAVKGPPPFEVPRMSFVQAGLAISDDRETVFLVEQYIPQSESQGNYFCKYLNNGSHKPRQFGQSGLQKIKSDRAVFLSFVQHVQYVRTGGSVFVSDFQGGHTMLTDPQILTLWELETVSLLFGPGNINFDSFPKPNDGHSCNKYCLHYGLVPFTQDAPIIVEDDEEQANEGGESNAVGNIQPEQEQADVGADGGEEGPKDRQGSASSSLPSRIHMCHQEIHKEPTVEKA